MPTSHKYRKVKGIKLMEGIGNENERSLSNIQAYGI